MKPDLIKHLSGETIGRFPVWLMRQAGRYLPEYRALRKEHSFWESVTSPDLAAEITLMPANHLAVDALILFSDILTLPHSLGIPIELQESMGPVLRTPLREEASFEVFKGFRAADHCSYVGQTLKTVRSRMKPETALIGFAGAPWTVSCYLIEGRGKTNFAALHQWMHRNPRTLVRALDVLADATIQYLQFQIDQGADLVQLFDTWVSEMPRPFFVEHYGPMLKRIADAISDKKVPFIYYSRHAHHLLSVMGPLEGAILGIDELVPLSEIDKALGHRHSLQGNLAPELLLSDEGTVRLHTRRLVGEARKLSKPAILNLGHGVLPPTPLANVQAFVEEARTLWV